MNALIPWRATSVGRLISNIDAFVKRGPIRARVGRVATPAAALVSAVPDGPSSARRAGLRYVTDQMPGIRRKTVGKGFAYVGTDGRPVPAATRARIRALAIPPAWTHVWIAPDDRAHIQATGRDARSRKQYRYHADWSAERDSAKYGRLLAFGRALPALRRRVRADLMAAPLSRRWVLATVITLLERTVIRVGNGEYARTNGSYGLTTFKDRHAKVNGGRVVFQFRAKSGIEQRVAINDRALAKRVRRCQELPGQTLFQYLDDAGQPSAIDSADVNEYLRDAMGDEFTAKDFRTWAGTVAAACALAGVETPATESARKRELVRAIDDVARRLGNTRAVCRKCYIHPAIVGAFVSGALRSTSLAGGTDGGPTDKIEREVLALLQGPGRAARGRVVRFGRVRPFAGAQPRG